MFKKKSNSRARWKLLLLLPVAALIMYAFACSDMSGQKEQKEIEPVHLSFRDNTGREVRTFKLEVGDDSSPDNASFRELKEWLSSQEKETIQIYRVSIKAPPDTRMSVITDIRGILRNHFVLKVSYTL